jgi:hypothetical protein
VSWRTGRTAFAPHTASTVVAVFTMFMMPATFTTPVGAAVTARAMLAMLSTAVMRRRPGWAHPLGIHPVHDAVELFNNSIEAAGGIVACCSPLIGRPFLGSPREMNPASHGPKHHHTPGHGQPFQWTIHRMFSLSMTVLPSFTGRFRGGIEVNSMLLST